MPRQRFQKQKGNPDGECLVPRLRVGGVGAHRDAPIWFKISTALSEIVVDMVAKLIIGAFFVHGELGAKAGWITFQGERKE